MYPARGLRLESRLRGIAPYGVRTFLSHPPKNGNRSDSPPFQNRQNYTVNKSVNQLVSASGTAQNPKAESPKAERNPKPEIRTI
jgi:hypothetical protein